MKPNSHNPMVETEVFLKIFGDVQDVGMRYQTREQARALGLRGWVRNAADGTVEILAQGPKPDLQKFLAWLKTGPRFAQIIKLQVTWQKPGARRLPEFFIQASNN